MATEPQPQLESQPVLLEARGIGRQDLRRKVWLLRHLSLTIRGSERLAITGPSGSGKTLLLRALAQLDPIQEGEVLWCGRSVPDAEIPRFRSKVVYLHQRPQFVEGTVSDNLRLALDLHVHRPKRRWDETAVTQWLDCVNRDASFLAKSCEELSGGEAQIVALLRVLQLAPQVLLLDEPTAALDAGATRDLQRLVGSWLSHDGPPEAVGEQGDEAASDSAPRRQRATVWVTHRQQQAAEVADRVLQMDTGNLRSAETDRRSNSDANSDSSSDWNSDAPSDGGGLAHG